MPKTYENITSDTKHRVNKHLDAAMARFHKELAKAEVRVTVLLAHAPRDENDDPVGDAVTHGGYPAMATIKINSLKDRVAGLGDCTLIVDGDKYDEWSDAELLAICDHELTHIEVVIDDGGAIVIDDAGRPKLRLRKHDFQIGGFHDVSERHKEAAVEVQAITKVAKEFIVQGVLPGF